MLAPYGQGAAAAPSCPKARSWEIVMRIWVNPENRFWRALGRLISFFSLLWRVAPHGMGRIDWALAWELSGILWSDFPKGYKAELW